MYFYTIFIGLLTFNLSVQKKLNQGNYLGKQGSNLCEHGKAKVNIWKIQNLIVLCLFHNVIVHGCYKFKDHD